MTRIINVYAFRSLTLFVFFLYVVSLGLGCDSSGGDGVPIPTGGGADPNGIGGAGGGSDHGGGGGIGIAGSNTPGGGGGDGGGDGGGIDVALSANLIGSPPDRTSRIEDGFFTQNFGIATVFNISLELSNVTSFNVTSQILGASIWTDLLASPTGERLLSSADAILRTVATIDATLDPFITIHMNSLPFPTRGDDPALVNGTYFQLLRLREAIANDSGAGITLVAKNDPNLRGGLLFVNVYLAGPSSLRAAIRPNIDAAIQLWRDIFSGIGIQLDVQLIELPESDGLLPSPIEGSALYQTQAVTNRSPARPYPLNMYIGDDINLDLADADPLGIAAAIPGPAVPTVRSAVAISLTASAGPDGAFDPNEQRIFGETLAHEAGHYLGLFHPVELDFTTGIFTPGDPLADTPVCSTIVDCRAISLTENLMFPTPDGITPQQTLSNDQGGVVNLQAIVD